MRLPTPLLWSIASVAACSSGGDQAANAKQSEASVAAVAPFQLRDTSEWVGMVDGGRRAVLERDGVMIDTVDLAFGVHALGRDTLLFLPVRTGYFEVGANGDSTGYPAIGEHVLWTRGERRSIKPRLPWFEPYFSSPTFADGALHYWGLRPLREEGGRYMVYAGRWRVAADVVDTLALDSLDLHTDARGALAEPVVAGDGHVIYRAEGIAFRVAPDLRSAERLP
jgi:hypothetical protein